MHFFSHIANTPMVSTTAIDPNILYPLPYLTQGSTLSFQRIRKGEGSTTIPCHIILQSEWRNDGSISWSYYDEYDPTRLLLPPKRPLVEDQSSSLHVKQPHQSPPLPYQLRDVSSHDKDENDETKDDDSVRSKTITNKITSLGRLEPHVSLHLVNIDDNDINAAATTITKQNNGNTAAIVITLTVPEKVNIEIDVCSSDGNDYGSGGSIVMMNPTNNRIGGKIEGDVSIQTNQGGTIHIHKVRGNTIDLRTNGMGSSIVIHNVIESQNLMLQATTTT